MSRFLISVFVAAAYAFPAFAGEANVIEVKTDALGEGKYRFHVTVDHTDDGWDHFANVWQVLGPDGTVLGTRKLAHPHVEEMPFTRSHIIEVPAGVYEVTVRAGDLMHGFGGEEMVVKLR